MVQVITMYNCKFSQEREVLHIRHLQFYQKTCIQMGKRMRKLSKPNRFATFFTNLKTMPPGVLLYQHGGRPFLLIEIQAMNKAVPRAIQTHSHRHKPSNVFYMEKTVTTLFKQCLSHRTSIHHKCCYTQRLFEFREQQIDCTVDREDREHNKQWTECSVGRFHRDRGQRAQVEGSYNYFWALALIPCQARQ